MSNNLLHRKICVLGVAGGSASGKTTIIKKVQEYFGNDIAVISMTIIIKRMMKCRLRSAAS